MKDAPTLTKFDRTIPVEVSNIVAKMMSKKPEDRYKTPAEVIQALGQWLLKGGRVVAGLSNTEIGQSDQATLDSVVAPNTKRISKKVAETQNARKNDLKLWFSIGGGIFAAMLLCGFISYMLFSKPKDKAEANNNTVNNDRQTFSNDNVNDNNNRNNFTQPGVSAAKPSNLIYKLDLTHQAPFMSRGISEISGNTLSGLGFAEQSRTGVGVIPSGWYGVAWDTESISEFGVEEKVGKKAITMNNVKLAKASPVNFTGMIFSPKLRYSSKSVFVRFEYFSDSLNNIPNLKFKQFLPDVREAWTVNKPGNIPPSRGVWKKIDIEVDLKGAEEGYFEFHFSESNPQKGFYLSEFEIYSSKPTDAVTLNNEETTNTSLVSNGEKTETVYDEEDFKNFKMIYELPIQKWKPFKKKTVNTETNNGQFPFLEKGLKMHTWKGNTTAEFELVKGEEGNELKMSNVSKDIGCQIRIDADFELGMKLKRGNKYRGLVDYKSINQGYGSIGFLGEAYKLLGQAVLNKDDTNWRKVFVEITHSGERIRLTLNNDAFGNGQSLAIRSFSLWESK
jgi:hypothetical protein